LDLELASAKTEVENLLNAGNLASGQGGIVFGDLVATSDADVNATLANEGGDVGGGQEDQGNGEILDEGDVETGFAAELNIRAGEEIEGCLLETAL
jgi:hypothetical protein